MLYEGDTDFSVSLADGKGAVQEWRWSLCVRSGWRRCCTSGWWRTESCRRRQPWCATSWPTWTGKAPGSAAPSSACCRWTTKVRCAGFCHWWELPWVPFSLRQNTSFVNTKVCLSWQNWFIEVSWLLKSATFTEVSWVYSVQLTLLRWVNNNRELLAVVLLAAQSALQLNYTKVCKA